MRVFNRTGAALALLMLCGAAQAADLNVRLDARDILRKHVHTDLSLAVQPGPLTLVFPQWIPGEHGPTGPLETLIGMRLVANGHELTWQRDPFDMFAVKTTVPAGTSRLEIALDTGLPTEGGEFTAGPASSAQLAVISWNQFVLFPKGRDAAKLTTAATLLAPPQWQLSSSLALSPQGDGAVGLEEVSLAQLIDSPVQMGRYLRRIELPGSAPLPQLKHVISIAADSDAAFTLPGDFAASYGRLVAQAGMLFGTRMYRHYTWLLTLSDHTTHFGLEHHESSDDRVDEGSLGDVPQREGVAELLAHEYVHSWNGKYRRPAGLLSPDYQKPMDGSLLWVYEGMTQFWGNVLPVRAGLTPPESYRDDLASVAGYFDIQTGNRWRPLADTAVAAQVLYNAPTTWSLSRRSVDFYDASHFLWLNVDSELRTRSGGKVSLDDYVKRFYAGSGGAPALKPYVEADVYATLASLVPADWHAIIHRHLDSLGPETLLDALKGAGWQLTYSADKNPYLEAQQKRRKSTVRLWSIGLALDSKNTVVETVESRAAAKAGIGPGMEILAVNGHRFSGEVLDAALEAAKADKKPIDFLIQDADYYRTISVTYTDGPRWPHLTRIEGKPDLLGEVLKARTN
ncbi:MAG: M61 family metallopeptidase [Proteobacteria bacterium]|nr:M61 family metallopeptidase [Pseudomonadota bacterium]